MEGSVEGKITEGMTKIYDKSFTIQGCNSYLEWKRKVSNKEMDQNYPRITTKEEK